MRREAVWGFSLGFLAGAVGALLLAPHSGRRTRLALRHGAARAGLELKKAGHQLSYLGRDLYERGRELTSEARHWLRSAA
ncbi:MAG: YtxH domain-containing protein [Bryobacterales bacterium]|nr:YtxH domain-containing protein [Bryobacteraceae bacterium]MDW8355351.1 YtxH domain-containing protein [Bryobacterales bacterium]